MKTHHLSTRSTGLPLFFMYYAPWYDDPCDATPFEKSAALCQFLTVAQDLFSRFAKKRSTGEGVTPRLRLTVRKDGDWGAVEGRRMRP